ncbi:hypothetical protein DRJ17_06585 [Candidatus Woesearchaeota archaeon]|nr:MAG: hypothetical protein DRJ17_06585 [Candidatus Woesearchaeota archaeon]
MKKHKSIGYPYDVWKAEKLYKKNPKEYRQLSLWKQENIRIAFLDKDISVYFIARVLGHHCGYCFKYQLGTSCKDCPLQCLNKTWNEMRWKRIWMTKRNKKKEFAKLHKKWCKEIGLWQDDWE